VIEIALIDFLLRDFTLNDKDIPLHARNPILKIAPFAALSYPASVGHSQLGDALFDKGPLLPKLQIAAIQRREIRIGKKPRKY